MTYNMFGSESQPLNIKLSRFFNSLHLFNSLKSYPPRETSFLNFLVFLVPSKITLAC